MRPELLLRTSNRPPPGIPVLAPGERITPEILDYLRYARQKGCSMTAPEEAKIGRLDVLAAQGFFSAADQLLEAILLAAKTRIVGADLNELAPVLDGSGVSTATACKILRELLLALWPQAGPQTGKRQCR